MIVIDIIKIMLKFNLYIGPKIGFFLTCHVVALESAQFLGEDITTSSAAADGIWTGKDWTNDIYEIGVKNGLPYGLIDEVSARIDQT